MLSGHLAIGLALKARYREVPLRVLVLSVLLLDLIWLVLVAKGVEAFRISPAAHGALQVDHYHSVYSHSLIWPLFYALFVFLTFVRAAGQRHWAVPLSLGVFSHWLLDALLYSNLPFGNFGPNQRFGLNFISFPHIVPLAIEGIIVFAGWGLYYRSHRLLARRQWLLWSNLAILLLLLFSHQFLLSVFK